MRKVMVIVVSCLMMVAAPAFAELPSAIPQPMVTATLTNEQGMQQLIKVFQQDQGKVMRANFENMLSDNMAALVWTGKDAKQYLGKTHFVINYLMPEVDQYKNYKKIVGRTMIGLSPSSHDPVLVVFYKTQVITKEGLSQSWAGCDLYTFRNGKIVFARIQPDTMTRWNKSDNANLEKTYQLIDKYHKEQTSAANRIGMFSLLDLKQTKMKSSKRIKAIVKMMSPDVVQTSWEPEGIVFLPNVKAIKKMFQKNLLKLFPDFYEGVESYIISGNALVMLQNPSGTMKKKSGPSFNAWYNCDIYFFGGKTGKEINYLLFQRDTYSDHRQLQDEEVKK